VVFCSAGVRRVASVLSLLAFGLAAALPTEHLHEADSAGIHGPVVHRHLDGDGLASPSPIPGDSDDDHTAARPIGAAFQISPKFSAPAPAIVASILKVAAHLPVLRDLTEHRDLVAHDPPLRLLPPRDPPSRV